MALPNGKAFSTLAKSAAVSAGFFARIMTETLVANPVIAFTEKSDALYPMDLMTCFAVAVLDMHATYRPRLISARQILFILGGHVGGDRAPPPV